MRRHRRRHILNARARQTLLLLVGAGIIGWLNFWSLTEFVLGSGSSPR